MASVVGIVNSAGVKIGVKNRITSLDEGTPLANLGDDRYDEIKDEILRSHPWNFAVKRAKLARSTETPDTEFDYFYVLPSDWIRTILVHDNDDSVGTVYYKEEGGKILSDAEDIYVKYVSNVADPNLMTPDFREVIATMLAVEGAISIVNSRTLSEYWDSKLTKKLLRAKSTDSLSDRPDRRPLGNWVTRRHRTFGFGRNR